ncbi:MAG TPA: MSMEG_0565 family glycosyltransferase [Xanthobacteraceae bacterium]
MRHPLRIAILAHSTNPRGGVVHALELGDALTRLGHHATVHAPGARGTGFFRATLCNTACVPATPVGRDVTAMVETRIADYLRHFEQAQNRSFDIWHAQDGISGNALATLKELGLIPGFARTVHHVDTFEDARLEALQARAIAAADCRLVVSRVWRHWLRRELGHHAHQIRNGVDTKRFSPTPDAADAALRARLSLPRGARAFLAIGGVEERKNTIRLLDAFRMFHARHPSSCLVIAGGASLLDHDRYQARFARALAQSGLPVGAVIRLGPWPQELMPALYRAAHALVFPSTKEGFGLVVLEAMASGVPVVTSRIAPFTEYLGEPDVLWCNPFDPASIAAAMAASLDIARRGPLIARGRVIAGRHDWTTTARAHLAIYGKLAEAVRA